VVGSLYVAAQYPALDAGNRGSQDMRVMDKGNQAFTFAAGKSWWRDACAGVPAWRWPSSL
jgi:hypothetical protein